MLHDASIGLLNIKLETKKRVHTSVYAPEIYDYKIFSPLSYQKFLRSKFSGKNLETSAPK